MYIMGENPVLSDPNVAHAEHWFRELEFLAVQDLFLTETARWADVVLPGSSFAEKDGTFVNTERHIQLSDSGASIRRARRAATSTSSSTCRTGSASRPTSASPAEVMDEIATGHADLAGRVATTSCGGERSLQYPVLTPDSPGTAVPVRRPLPDAGRPGAASSASSSCRRASCLTRSTRSCSTRAGRCTTGTRAR